MIIDESDLDLDEDVCLHLGQPFTGVARAHHPGGELKREAAYADGFEQGVCREWYADGQLRIEWTAVRGVVQGTLREWHENGEPKVVATYSRGVELTYEEWDEAGALEVRRELDPDSPLASYAEGSEPGSD